MCVWGGRVHTGACRIDKVICARAFYAIILLYAFGLFHYYFFNIKTKLLCYYTNYFNTFNKSFAKASLLVLLLVTSYILQHKFCLIHTTVPTPNSPSATGWNSLTFVTSLFIHLNHLKATCAIHIYLRRSFPSSLSILLFRYLHWICQHINL